MLFDEIYKVDKKDWENIQRYLFIKGYHWSNNDTNIINYPDSINNYQAKMMIYVYDKNLTHSNLEYYKAYYSKQKYIYFTSREKKLKRILNESKN